MILFCDTSALMKAYASEQHSHEVRAWLKKASHSYVSLITWVEMHAAFALKERTSQITQAEVRAGLVRLTNEWSSFNKLTIDTELVQNASELAVRFGLRAYDSVQLASVHLLHRQLGSNLMFCCFDKQLNAAAEALGLQVSNT